MSTRPSRIVGAVACLAFACSGRRINVRQDDEALADGVQEFAQSLLTFNPAVEAFNVAGSRAAGIHAARRASTARLSTPQTYEELADSCLEEGCPVEMVTELIDELKRVQAWDEARAKTEEERKSSQNTLAAVIAKLENDGYGPDQVDKVLGDVKETQGQIQGIVERVASASESSPDPAAYQAMAQECLEDGCPIDSVEKLLQGLKAEEDANSDIASTVKELEKALTENKEKQGWIQFFVEEISKVQRMMK